MSDLLERIDPGRRTRRNGAKRVWLLTQPTFSHFCPKHLYYIIHVLDNTCLVYWWFDILVCSLVRLMMNHLLIDLLFIDKTCVFQPSFRFHKMRFLFFSGIKSDQIVFFSFYSLWLSMAVTGNPNSYPNKSYLGFSAIWRDPHCPIHILLFFPANILNRNWG